MHWHRLKRNGSTELTPWPSIEERFFAFICPEPYSGCWLWTGAVYHTGRGAKYQYGAFNPSGTTVHAHRFSYELHIGPIGKDLFCCHRCDTPLCVNPEHLFVGTALDNMRDSIAKDRHARGERGKGAKLTDADVIEIRRLYASGEATRKQLSKRFNADYSALCKIVKGKRWTHLPCS